MRAGVTSEKSSAQVLILGAGISGLSLAYAMRGKDVLVLEREDGVGGSLRTDCQGPYKIDRTGHLLHFKDPEVLDFVRKSLHVRFVTHKRSAVVLLEDAAVPYPFQYHIGWLPAEQRFECLSGFVDALLEKWGSSKAESFADWSLASYGEGICRYFMHPYNRKIWATDIRKMSFEWARKFVPPPDVELVLRGALQAHQGNDFGYNSTFLYPNRGGSGAIPEGIRGALPEGSVRLNTDVVEVDIHKKQITSQDGKRFHYETLIVTAPLKHFVLKVLQRPDASLREAALRLRSQSVMYQVYAYRRNHRHDKNHWYYVPGRQYPFYRVGILSNYATDIAPQNETLLCAEYGISGDRPISPNKFPSILQGATGLKKLGIVPRNANLKHIHSGSITPAYCIFDKYRVTARDHIRKTLGSKSVFLLGRFGLWSYSSAGEAISEAFKLARWLESSEDRRRRERR